jgi:transposase
VPVPRKYPNELRERSVRLVTEAMAEDPDLSLNAAVHRIGPKVGIVPDTLRAWAKQNRVDAGVTPGTTSSDASKIKALEQQVKELKRANEILLAASSSSRGSSTRDFPGSRVHRSVRGPCFRGRSAVGGRADLRRAH